MSAPTRRDGIPRATIELTEAEIDSLLQYAFIGAAFARSLKMSLNGASYEMGDQAVSKLLTLLRLERNGGAFSSPPKPNLHEVKS